MIIVSIMLVKCKTCKKEFSVKPFWVKNGGGIYCSLTCKYEGTRNGKIMPCFICGKQKYKTLKQIKRSKSGKFFCDKSCQTIWRNQEFIGPKHANWKTGRNAYRSVLTRHKVPKICLVCKSKDERILAVHHIDHDRLNNKLSNLTWLCHNCHFLVHHDNVERKRFIDIITKR